MAALSDRALRLAGLVTAAVSLVCIAAAVGLGIAGPRAARGFLPESGQAIWLLNAFTTGLLGLLIVRRRPRHLIGWLLLLTSVFDSGAIVPGFLAVDALSPGARPAGWVLWEGWLYNWLTGVASTFTLFLLFFFPDGRLPDPRWRWPFRAALALTLAVGITTGLDPAGSTLGQNLPVVPNPIGVRAMAGVSPALGTAWVAGMLIMIVVSVILRFRRARGVEREQLRWFVAVAALAVGLSLLGFALALLNPTVGDQLAAMSFDLGVGVILPATIGLAVIRYGLYDIDLFVSRTLVYGALAAFITAVYVGVAVGLGALVGSGGKPNLALSIVATAIVAVAFQPLRERLQRVANRLVYGRRATPYEVLAEFSGRVADAYVGDEVLDRMARVLGEGTAAERAEVWLRSGARLRLAAAWPAGVEAAEVAVSGQLLPPLAAGLAVPVRQQGELLGALAVTKRRGESLSPMEARLVEHAAAQAGLLLKNVRLRDELVQRMEDLRASRQRLVAAQDLERRQIERNLHDGAQQHLVALKVKVGLAEALMARDPEKGRATIAQLKHDADEAIETVRDLARGIYPPLLAERGLGAALEAQARRATVPVEVEVDGAGRYPQEVETAVYFCVLEALQNVQKYAQAQSAKVRLEQRGGKLEFEVRDDGRGFEATARRGSGLANMEDRLEAIGGSATVESEPGRGTRVTGSVPVPA